MTIATFVSTLALGFFVGVFVRSLYSISAVMLAGVLLVSVILLVVRAIRRRLTLLFFMTPLFCASLVLGIVRMDIAFVREIPLLEARLNQKIELIGVVKGEPDVREGNVRLYVRAQKILSPEEGEVETGVLVIVPLHTEVAYGDEIRVSGTLQKPEAFETGEGRVFDYPGFLAKEGILYEVPFAHIESTGNSEKFFLKKFAIAVKRFYINGLASVLPEPLSGLAAGITAGDKRGLGKELSDTFQVVGLTHIVVLSGYNIMVVLAAIGSLLARMPRIIRLGISGLVALLFVLMTGGASSSVRAAFMALVAIAGKLTGRVYLAMRALLLIAFCMVLWNPYVLVFDPGFQLSVLATFGLIAFSGAVAKRLQFVTESFGLREIISTTIATQFVVLPLLLYKNGVFPFYTLPVNLLSLVVLPWAMLASFIAGAAGAMVGGFAVVFAAPALVLLSYVTFIAKLFASLPFSSIQIPAFGVALLCALYVSIFVLYRTYENGRKNPAVSDSEKGN